jgi:hypothetical protein
MTHPNTSRLRILFCCALAAVLASCGKQRDAEKQEAGQVVNEERGSGKQPRHGFQDYVKNPNLFDEESRKAARAESAPPPTDQELARIVAAMRTRKLAHEELQQLRKAGRRVAPPLLEALRDEKFLFHRYGKSVLDGTPLDIALDLLEPFALPETKVLQPVLNLPDASYHYHALYHLARCGKDDAIDVLKTGLKAEAEQSRTYTLMGLEFLKQTGRGSAKFRRELFEAAVPLLADKEYSPAEQAPLALLVLDRERAIKVLLGKEVFRAGNRRIDKVLKALEYEGVPVPGPQLRELLSAMKNKASGYPFDWAYTDGLRLLARAEGAKAKDLIADAEKWGNELVKRGAAEAGQIAANVRDPYGYVSGLYEKKGAAGLTEPQLHYLTLWWLDAEVRNGGFSQYYFNSAGELASHAVKAARVVGAPELAGIIEKANAHFGPKGPHPDRAKRMQQLSKIEVEVFEKLDTQYYKCSERLSEILPRYAAAHAESFRPGK